MQPDRDGVSNLGCGVRRRNIFPFVLLLFIFTFIFLPILSFLLLLLLCLCPRDIQCSDIALFRFESFS